MPSGAVLSWCPSGRVTKTSRRPSIGLSSWLETGKLLHAGHPVLAMAAANAKAEQDAAGNRKLSKRKSTGRIDPLVALTMAVGIAARPAPVFDVAGMIG